MLDEHDKSEDIDTSDKDSTSEDDSSQENDSEDSKENDSSEEDPQDITKIMVNELKEQYKIYSKMDKLNGIDIKSLLIEGDCNSISDAIEKFPELLAKFTTEALFRSILCGDCEMYDYLLSEGGQPDCIEILKSGAAWGSSKIMKWCRDNMKLNAEGKHIVKSYLAMCKEPLLEAGDNKNWICLIE